LQKKYGLKIIEGEGSMNLNQRAFILRLADWKIAED
jgi:hypothetical protein